MCRLAVNAIQLANGVCERFDRPVRVVDDIVGKCETLFAAGLGGQCGVGIIFRNLVTLHQASPLLRFRAIHDKNSIILFRRTGFCQQRNFDDRIVVTCVFGRLQFALYMIMNQRMENAFERLPGRWIGKDSLSECFSVEITSLIQYHFTKCIHDRLEAFGTRCNDIASNLVGVNYGYTECFEKLGNRGLAAGDASSQCNAKHRHGRAYSPRYHERMLSP